MDNKQDERVSNKPVFGSVIYKVYSICLMEKKQRDEIS